MVQAPLKLSSQGPPGGGGGGVSATLCSGTLNCERWPRVPALHESQQASGEGQSGLGLVESVAEEGGAAGAVRSAGGAEGTCSGGPKGSWWRQGASVPAETPPNSESGGAAWGYCWRERGEAEEAGAEG